MRPSWKAFPTSSTMDRKQTPFPTDLLWSQHIVGPSGNARVNYGDELSEPWVFYMVYAQHVHLNPVCPVLPTERDIMMLARQVVLLIVSILNCVWIILQIRKAKILCSGYYILWSAGMYEYISTGCIAENCRHWGAESGKLCVPDDYFCINLETIPAFHQAVPDREQAAIFWLAICNW